MQMGSSGLNPLWVEKEVLSWKEPRLCSLTAWHSIQAVSPSDSSSVKQRLSYHSIELL